MEALRCLAKLQFTSRASADLEDIYNDLIKRSPSGIRDVISAIYDSLNFIAEHPYGSEQTNDPDVRATVVRRYRYKIIYNIGAERSKCFPYAIPQSGRGNTGDNRVD